MRILPDAVLVGLALVATGCKPPVQTTPPAADAPAAVVALTGASVLIGAGDIASCSSSGDESTARLVDSVLRTNSAAKVHDEVLTLGDNAYPSGSTADFERCFTPSWGDSAKLIMKNIRPSDIACRYGGEELAVVLSECDLESARVRAEQLCRAVRETNLVHLGQTLPAPTASFGVAAYPGNGTKPADLLKAADQALYRAKQEGRDRVCIAPEGPPAAL